MVFMLGSCKHRGLCWGVKRRLASACIPYLSNVQWVFSSQQFFCSHHRAWSDQSCGAPDQTHKSFSFICVWLKHSTILNTDNLWINDQTMTGHSTFKMNDLCCNSITQSVTRVWSWNVFPSSRSMDTLMNTTWSQHVCTNTAWTKQEITESGKVVIYGDVI